MARFIIISPVYGCPPSAPSGRQLPIGATIASDVGSALPGDIVFPSFAASPSKLNVAPLDASASALMGGAAIVTLAQVVSGNLSLGGAGIGLGQ